jgi:uncharacterized protein (DUF362 family)
MNAKVIVVKGKGVITSSGEIDKKKLERMFERGFHLLTRQKDMKSSFHFVFKESDKIGIKINTLGGKMISTRSEVSFSLASLLSNGGGDPNKIIIWDRTNSELKESGYRLNMNRNGIKVFSTDSQGIGYTSNLVDHLNIGSLFSVIQAKMISSSISLAVLKDHGLAGVTAGMKNYFGAIHNPNKYHDTNCNPYIAELMDTSLIKSKHKISILDGLTVQYHLGPSFHAKWASREGLIIFSFDPVAADFIGWQIIEDLRSQKGLPSLLEENREPAYLKTAETMGLGKASFEAIEVIEENL